MVNCLASLTVVLVGLPVHFLLRQMRTYVMCSYSVILYTGLVVAYFLSIIQTVTVTQLNVLIVTILCAVLISER